MYTICQNFAAWSFNGANQSVIDFVAVVINCGLVALLLAPVFALLKKLFK